MRYIACLTDTEAVCLLPVANLLVFSSVTVTAYLLAANIFGDARRRAEIGGIAFIELNPRENVLWRVFLGVAIVSGVAVLLSILYGLTGWPWLKLLAVGGLFLCYLVMVSTIIYDYWKLSRMGTPEVRTTYFVLTRQLPPP